MRVFRPAGVFVVTASLLGCSDHASRGPSTLTSPDPVATATAPGEGVSGATGARQLSATVQFGNPNGGSGFPPNPPHDQSAHAADNLIPRTVVIDRGGTVTFKTFGVHQVAIYDNGVQPGDVDTTDVVLTDSGCPKGPPPNFNVPLLIDDDTNRIALYSQPCLPPPAVQRGGA